VCSGPGGIAQFAFEEDFWGAVFVLGDEVLAEEGKDDVVYFRGERVPGCHCRVIDRGIGYESSEEWPALHGLVQSIRRRTLVQK